MNVIDFGESAAYVDLGIERAPDRATRTHAVAAALRAKLPAADVVIGGGTIVLVGSEGLDLAAIVRDAQGAAEHHPAPATRTHVVSVAYDGPDLGGLAERLGVPPAEITAIHQAREVIVELVGFLPGFAYLGPIDERLVVPRRPSPRPRVPALSVGVAGSFTGIYPFASPGGWNLIGRALDVVPFDPARDPPVIFAPGDRVRFRAVAEAAPPAARSPSLAPGASDGEDRTRAALEVVAVPAGATVQDAGRPGQLGRGIPPSGPLDPEAHADANRAVGNAPHAAAIEIPLGAFEIRAHRALTVSVDGALATALSAGERFVVPPSAGAVRYLAVAGGIDVPVVLGARATLLVAGVGGHRGRALRPGDVLPIGDAAPNAPGPVRGKGSLPVPAVLDALPGPHLDRFPTGALDALLATTFAVSRLGDRVGVRLEGGRVPRDRGDLALPTPMLRGAVQVATDGTPIVLGPDHPTTGGYPVIAVLRRSSQALLTRLRPGHAVRFRMT